MLEKKNKGFYKKLMKTCMCIMMLFTKKENIMIYNFLSIKNAKNCIYKICLENQTLSASLPFVQYAKHAIDLGDF